MPFLPLFAIYDFLNLLHGDNIMIIHQKYQWNANKNLITNIIKSLFDHHVKFTSIFLRSRIILLELSKWSIMNFLPFISRVYNIVIFMHEMLHSAWDNVNATKMSTIIGILVFLLLVKKCFCVYVQPNSKALFMDKCAN